jgi:nucleoside-triphosphatase
VGKALLLTGRPGVGKTTVIRAVAAELDPRVGGFYTEEIREGRRRIGFRLIAIGTDQTQEGLLATVGSPSRHRVGAYGVHLNDLERVGVRAVRRAVEDPGIAVVVIDEIGKMELLSSEFREAVLTALSSPKPVLATIMSGRQPWVEAIKARPDATMIEVTSLNRRELPDRILDWLRMAA